MSEVACPRRLHRKRSVVIEMRAGSFIQRDRVDSTSPIHRSVIDDRSWHYAQGNRDCSELVWERHTCVDE